MKLTIIRASALFLLFTAQAIAAPTLEEVQRFVEIRQIPYSIPLAFDEALRASLVSIESTALKQFRMGAKGWNWKHPYFQQSYSQAMEAVRPLLADNWNRCTYPVIKANSESYNSLAHAYKSSMSRLSDKEFDELRSFYSSETGSRYRSYLAFARKAYMEMEVVRQKKQLGFPELQTPTLTIDPNSAAIGFLRTTHERLGIAPNYRDYHRELAENLSFLPDAYRTLSTMLSDGDKQEIEHFLKSNVGQKEAQLIQTWQAELAMKLFAAERDCQSEKKLQELSAKWKP